MNIIRLLIIIGIASGGYTYWKEHRTPTAQVESDPAASENGFASLPPAEGQDSQMVFVVAAENCPHEDAQRADRLTEELSQKGIPVERTHNVNFRLTSPPESSVMERMTSIMNGPLPIVFVNGRAKSNPSLEEVVAEFNGNLE
ncbi:MAG TPA: hypothetical protein VIE65_10040 [Methylobacter sp.]|jgi:hypothetical protein